MRRGVRRDPLQPHLEHALGEKGSPALWFALFGGGTAWFASLVISFFLVSWACEGRGFVLPLISLVALIVCLAALLVGYRLWRGTGIEEVGEARSPVTRTRLLASVGTALSAVFALIVLMQVVAGLMMSPCEMMPRGPMDPDAAAPPADGHEYALLEGTAL